MDPLRRNPERREESNSPIPQGNFCKNRRGNTIWLFVKRFINDFCFLSQFLQALKLKLWD